MKRNICVTLFALLIILNVYDIYSTHTLLTSGEGFYEQNAFLLLLMDKCGGFAAVIIFKVAVLLWFCSVLILSKAECELNVLLGGLILVVGWYSWVMYFANYKLMLFLYTIK
jgi:hypothetical protein